MRKFSVPEHFKGHQLRLRFEGVDSAFHVWINGNEVGYSQGSRNPSEFDVTEFVNEVGENNLAVQVYQYSDGSYLEDQVSHSRQNKTQKKLTWVISLIGSMVVKWHIP